MKRNNNTRKMAAVAMLGAVGFVLMFMEISVPIMPVFIKLDFSELPAVLASFAYGPVAGIAVCLLKNALHLLVTNTAGVGELSNFLLGIFFLVPSGLIYRKSHTRKGALIGAGVGCVAYALASVPINYFLIYPMFGQFVMPLPVSMEIDMNAESYEIPTGRSSQIAAISAPLAAPEAPSGRVT